MSRLVFLVLVSLAIASAAPAEKEPVPILKSVHDGPNPDGSYGYEYESGDGTKVQEQGHLEQVPAARSDDGEEGPAVANKAQGSYSFVAPDGQTYSVTYTADENGFQPQGDHLPQAPAIPEAIQRALKFIEEHPAKEEEH